MPSSPCPGIIQLFPGNGKTANLFYSALRKIREKAQVPRIAVEVVKMGGYKGELRGNFLGLAGKC